MAISRSALIPRVRAILEDRPYYDTATASNGADTTIAVSDGTRWNEGDFLENQADGEIMLVRSISSNDLTVVRDYFGQVTEGAITAGAVLKDPQFKYLAIDQALTAAIQRLWPYAWKAASTTFTASTATWYHLPATTLDVIKVHQNINSDEFRFGAGLGRPFEVRRSITLTSSGVGITFPGGLHSATANIVVTGRAAITGTSDIEDSGELPVAEAVIYGALARLLEGKEAPLVSLGTAREQMKAIRPGQRLQAGAYYEARFKQMLQDLRLKHEALLPPAWRV